jgi:ATP-binding cassette subfamily F protein uup
METMEVLEQRLAEYSGTLIVVSHDRQFLDNVVTSTIVFEQGGRLQEYVGGYSDWLRQGKELAEVDNPGSKRSSTSGDAVGGRQNTARKLSYNEQRELDALPKKIEQLEVTVSDFEKQVSSADFYAQDHDVTQPVLDEYSRTQAELDASVGRWTELEDRQLQYQQRRTT